MPKLFLLITFIFFSNIVYGQNEKAICDRLNQLNTAILNGTIPKQEAALQFKQIIEQLNIHVPQAQATQWIFPLKGYNVGAIGGTHGNGYSDKGYHYLDGNKHTAHPAHDIFINDRNQDNLDDRTRQPVEVLAVTDGIVIACSNDWQPSSRLRGGKYIWIYHPQYQLFTYYAHNQAIFVKPGDIIKAGQRIAEVGRTGFSAYQKRSPTHLHFSAFHAVNGLPVSFNAYSLLLNAKRV